MNAFDKNRNNNKSRKNSNKSGRKDKPISGIKRIGKSKPKTSDERNPNEYRKTSSLKSRISKKQTKDSNRNEKESVNKLGRFSKKTQGYSKKKEEFVVNDSSRKPSKKLDTNGFGNINRTGNSKKNTNEKDPTLGIRLNRYISNSGVCSRRDADQLIASGLIKVNGEVITEMGYRVKNADKVVYQGKQLSREKLVYALLNKPRDFITTMEDTHDRKTVMDLVKIPTGERVYPVGRLDRQTTGLLLFTNDGELAKKLSHPSSNVTKIYQAELDKDLTKNDFNAIAEGFELEDGQVIVDDLAYVSNKKNVLGVSLHSGKNRIVRRIFEHFGYRVVKLDRVIFAGLTKKDISRGKWRFLTESEIRRLKYF